MEVGMRSLKFHLIRGQNLLCFGPDGVEIHFSDYGAIIQMRGVNLDMPGTDDDPASNGAGKSSIPELLSIGLYGRTVKSPTKNKGQAIINCLASKGEVEVQWDDYRIIRKFSKSKTGSVSGELQVWKSPNRIWDTQSFMDRPTKALEEEIERAIGLSHHAFCNVVIFDDSNTYSFIEADADTKRTIVENLLDLDQYREYHKNAKDILKELKGRIVDLTKEYKALSDEVDASDKRLVALRTQEKTWASTKQSEIKELEVKLNAKQLKLEKMDGGEQLAAWQKGQDRITFLSDEITDLESKRNKLIDLIKTAREKLEIARNERQTVNEGVQEIQLGLQATKDELNRTLKLISKMEGLENGAQCPYCRGTIHRDNYDDVLVQSREVADQCRHRIDETSTSIKEGMENFSKKSVAVSTMESKISEADAKVAVIEGKVRSHRTEMLELSKVSKPDGGVAEQVLEAEILEVRKQLKNKQAEAEGFSPYREIADQAETERSQKVSGRDQKAKDLGLAEAEVPYYDFWLEAFGDNGIRKYVIDGIIPALNERIAHWLQILIDGMIELTFNNKLEQTILRKGNVAHYYNMSNGERRRINLAVTQAFAYVMMLSSGTCPNLVFLDEITGGGIDKAGTPGVYNMIFELAKERQVFVTTHNENLMTLLQGCETISLKKQNDITVLIS
jgi:DNA repair exonuclease SbcCD ATPase subunit